MLKVFRPFHRRGWSAFRLIVAAAYIMRFGEYGSVAVLHGLGVQKRVDSLHLPWYMIYPLLTAALFLADFLLRGVSSALRRNDLPMWLAPLEMAWPQSLRVQVWQPAFQDEAALYYLQPGRASRWLKNALFLTKLACLFVVTLRIMLLDRPCRKVFGILGG